VRWYVHRAVSAQVERRFHVACRAQACVVVCLSPHPWRAPAVARSWKSWDLCSMDVQRGSFLARCCRQRSASRGVSVGRAHSQAVINQLLSFLTKARSNASKKRARTWRVSRRETIDREAPHQSGKLSLPGLCVKRQDRVQIVAPIR